MEDLALVATSRDGAFSLLANQGLMDVGDNSTTGDGCLDQCVQFFVSSDSQLKYK
jgi:hypothetical protein